MTGRTGTTLWALAIMMSARVAVMVVPEVPRCPGGLLLVHTIH